jgi:hypothetical protein
LYPVDISIGETRKTYIIIVGEPEEKTSLGRPRRKWEDNTEVNLIGIGCVARYWIYLAQQRVQ